MSVCVFELCTFLLGFLLVVSTICSFVVVVIVVVVCCILFCSDTFGNDPPLNAPKFVAGARFFFDCATTYVRANRDDNKRWFDAKYLYVYLDSWDWIFFILSCGIKYERERQDQSFGKLRGDEDRDKQIDRHTAIKQYTHGSNTCSPPFKPTHEFER